jgi:hypothetical protein
MSKKQKKSKAVYDSKWEKKLALGVLRGVPFHQDSISYTVSHTYTPDFVIDKPSGKVLYVEAKGRFRTSSEAAKYIWVRGELTPEYEELIFLFYKPETPMPNSKIRKDGTKLTHGEWAEKNGFRYFTEKTIKEVL